MTPRRLFLITLLVLSRGPAYAEWVEVGTSAEFTYYIDPDTIRRKGDMVKMWVVLDFKTVQTLSDDTSHLSVKMQDEFDCAKERSRTLTFTEFSGDMGRGNVVYIKPDEGKWKPVAPGTVFQRLWQVACAKP